jgi:ankyrin repeat protein
MQEKTYKLQVVVGPDTKKYYIDYIKNTWKENGLVENVDYIFVGDGVNGVLVDNLEKSEHEFLWGHGKTTNGIHQIDISGNSESTAEVLKRRKDKTGVQHAFSCHSGAATYDAPEAIMHSGQKYPTMDPIIAESIAALGLFCHYFEREHNRVPNNYECLLFSMLTSPETIMLGGIKMCAPKEPVAKERINGYLEDKYNKVQNYLKGEGKDFLSIEKFLPENSAQRYFELALIMEARREKSNNAKKYVNGCLEAGVNPNSTLKDGTTALYAACSSGNAEVVELLLDYNASNDMPEHNGATPFLTACYAGHTEVVKLLMERIKNIDVNNGMNNGATPLYTASQNGHTEVVKLLLKEGADITNSMYNVFTPLMVAASSGQEGIVDILLKQPDANLEYLSKSCDGTAAKAFCNEKNIALPPEHQELFGKSAIQMAREKGHNTIADKIEERIKEIKEQTISKYNGKTTNDRGMSL